MENKKEINVLDELSKGASMGKDAIKFILEKVKDKGLEKELKTQYQKYEEIAEKIKAIYPEYSEDKPHETNVINKVMTWYGIEMKTMSDDTSSKLAELVMQGTNMGIIEGRRLLNHKHTNPEINSLVQEYVDMQEDAVEALKSFL